MKTLLILLLCLLSVPVAAQDSVLLLPKYFFSTQSGEVDRRMIYEPMASQYNDSDWSYLAVLMQNGYLYGPSVLYQECAGADSVAVYMRIQDTLSVGFVTGPSQNMMAVNSFRGPMSWTREVFKLPKNNLLVGLSLPVFGLGGTMLNEQGAKCYFGSVTAYYPAKAGVEVKSDIAQEGGAVYLDLLGRAAKPSRVMKRLSGNRFLVVQ